MPPAFARVACATLVAGVFHIGTAAQTPASAPAQQPPIRTGINLVRVDVYPTRDGVPVTDLAAEDFEVLEDGAAQRIESFEHVVVRPAGPQDQRAEPASQRQMVQAAANPRTRVFVIFLDAPNVAVDSAYRIEEPLIRLIDRLLGPDDLVGVMTPEMSASQVVLARKTQVIESGLRQAWPWGTRFTSLLDERETAYDVCYPAAGATMSPIAAEMIQRKRERATFEALEDLVRYLQAIREERKAILTVTEGWMRYGENRNLMRPAGGVPGLDPVTVGGTGQLTTRDTRNNLGPLSKTDCDADRLRLATMDNEEFFRDLVNDANRANVSFYPIDPRGLAVFDAPMHPDGRNDVRIDQDRKNLRTRQDSMHELAVGTDGLAVMDTNDLDGGLKRISDDLTSYYLLGYYSTNTKIDGTYRQIRVRVKRPGVNVRARRGYRAATAEETSGARRGSGPPAAASDAAFESAMGSLARIRPGAQFRINASALVPAGTVWVAGELAAGGAGPDPMAAGGTADIEAIVGAASATTRVQLKPGERRFLTSLKLPGMTAGDLEVRARLVPKGGMPATDAVRATLTADTAQPLVFRRGPSTANRLVPAADFQFSRSDRLRIEIPVPSGTKAVTGKLLDRAASALSVPVATTERVDETSGQHWVVADLVLAPLAPGDYAIELAFTSPSGTQRVVTAIRVTR